MSDPKAHVALLADIDALSRVAPSHSPADVVAALSRYAAGVGRVTLSREGVPRVANDCLVLLVHAAMEQERATRAEELLGCSLSCSSYTARMFVKATGLAE